MSNEKIKPKLNGTDETMLQCFYARAMHSRNPKNVCMETLCPYFVKKENIEKSIQATGATFTWGANSFTDLGDIAAGFRKVKDDNIARGMETLNPIYKLFMWMPIVHKFAEKILVFEKA